MPYQMDGVVQLVTAEHGGDAAVQGRHCHHFGGGRPAACAAGGGGRCLRPRDHDNRGETVGTVDLVASASYDETTLGSKVAYYFQRLGRWLGGLV